ncbi:hypothetical protein AVEN_199424-1, partial [Araneus ventricosus]
MAPRIFKKIGRRLRKLYGMKVSHEDSQDPAYGVSDEYATESPEDSPQ